MNKKISWGHILRLLIKAFILFILCNLLFALLNPIEALGRLSWYTSRERLPYGENPAQSYNLSLSNIPAMFATHELSQPKADNEYRVLLVGDSATWGWLLENDTTLAGRINTANTTTSDGKHIIAYNIGYPIMSLTKDLLLLDYAMRYDPDMIVWLITLESFPREKQLFPALLQNNAERTRHLIDTYTLNLDKDDPRFVEPDFLESTIIGQRRALADWLRLQLYGFSWVATGIDQYIRPDYDLRASDFDEDISWQTFDVEQTLTTDVLAFDVLAAGIARAGDVPVLLVNEPIFISEGINSDLRYNAFYPRWAYDQYRTLLTELATTNEWPLLDVWDVLPPETFTDSPVHTTPTGTQQLSERLIPLIAN